MWIATFRPLYCWSSTKVKFIDRDPHWYTRKVKEAIHIRLHLNNIKRDNGIEIPEAWMPTIKQHNSRWVPQRTSRETASNQNNEDRNAPINTASRYYRLKKTSSLAVETSRSTSKGLNPETKDELELSFQTTIHSLAIQGKKYAVSIKW